MGGSISKYTGWKQTCFLSSSFMNSVSDTVNLTGIISLFSNTLKNKILSIYSLFEQVGRRGFGSQGAGRSSWASTLDLSNSSLGRCKIIQFVHHKIIIEIMSIILSDRWAHPHRLCFPNRTGYANKPSADEFKHGCCPTCQTLMSKPFLYNLVSEAAVYVL